MTPNPSRHRSSKINYVNFSTPVINILPHNFHQRLVELENQFLINQSYEIVKEVIDLYKVNINSY
jgi:hypothetical protein